jgi:peptidoglycan/xylan/chitin deacetylase (PgdA/CDA1 family)
MSLRHRLFATAFRAITATGADRWLAPLARGRGAILTLHHVRPFSGDAFAPNRLLEITPSFLDEVLGWLAARAIPVVTLDELWQRVAAPEPQGFAVALTFDDGYRDNIIHAQPILARHRAPWTLFVTADFADGVGQLWWLELEDAIRQLERVEVDPGGGTLTFDTATDAGKSTAFEALYWKLRALPEERMRALIGQLAHRAGVDGMALTRSLCLSWDELRAAGSDPLLTFGAHTLSHPMLRKHDLAIAQREIVESKLRIEFELARPVSHFAYPVGDVTSAGPREFALARSAGFDLAVTTRPGHVFGEHLAHPHALPRISLNGLHQNLDALAAMLSGLPFLALNRGRRVSVE